MIKKWLDAIWGEFDKNDPLEYYILGFAWVMLILFLTVGNL